MSDCFVTSWTVACQASLSTGLPRQEYWVGYHFLLQGSNPRLLKWQTDSLPPGHQGSLTFKLLCNKITIWRLNSKHCLLLTVTKWKLYFADMDKASSSILESIKFWNFKSQWIVTTGAIITRFVVAQQKKQKQKTVFQCRRLEFNPWGRKIPWRREWRSTPVFLPGESRGRKSLAATAYEVKREWDVT